MTDTQNFAAGPDDLVSHEMIASMSGLEFMTGILEGKLPAPPIAQALNYRLSEVKEGEVSFEGTPTFHVLNPLGSVHGGWYGTLLDSCLACAVQTMLPKGQGYTTQEYKVNLIRPLTAKSGRVRATGRVQHVGRRTGVAVGEIRGVEDGKLYATGSTTCLIFSL